MTSSNGLSLTNSADDLGTPGQGKASSGPALTMPCPCLSTDYAFLFLENVQQEETMDKTVATAIEAIWKDLMEAELRALEPTPEDQLDSHSTGSHEFWSEDWNNSRLEAIHDSWGKHRWNRKTIKNWKNQSKARKAWGRKPVNINFMSEWDLHDDWD